MKLFNYKATALNTTLDSRILIPAEDLEGIINSWSPGKVLYHGFYDLEQRPELKGYEGLATPVFQTIHLDFDSKNDNGAAALSDVKKFCARLGESGYFGFVIYFSGNKGFHVAVHMSAFGIHGGEAKLLQDQIRNITHGLKVQYPTVDPSIHDPVRKFRAYRSLNEKSQLYKIRMDMPFQEFQLLTVDKIREMAKTQPEAPLLHATKSELIPWLQACALPANYSTTSSSVKEIAPGQMIDNSILKLRKYTDKKCIKAMFANPVPPQFNRHDVELCLIYDCRMIGMGKEETSKKMRAWAERAYPGESARVEDCAVRQVDDAYKRDIANDKAYDFGCFGDLKKEFCSAKCTIYKTLDPMKRARPLDCSTKHHLENQKAQGVQDDLNESALASRILEKLPEILERNGDYFQWMETHWKKLDRSGFNDIINQSCLAAYGEVAINKMLDSLANHIKKKIRTAPEENYFYSSHPFKFNFTDGTCHVGKDTDGKISLVMHPHKKEDYLGQCAPFPLFAAHQLPRSEHFSHYIAARRQAFDDESFNAFQEMFGAALIPYIPRIFILLGESDSGKSTSAVLLRRLLGAQNVSNVIPTGNYMFAWEDAIGKIANIVTELKGTDPLRDDRLKEIRDKEPVSIQRKNKPAVQAMLPFLHIYCCNKMPPSLEGNTGALDKRITLLRFVKGPINGYEGKESLAQWFWQFDAGSVLDFARQGLERLVKNGFRYSVPETSRKELQDWQDETDSVKLFVKDVEIGEWKVQHEGRSDCLVLGKTLHESFKKWSQESGHKPLSKVHLYKRLVQCGVDRATRHNQGPAFRWSALGNSVAEF